MTTDNPPQQQPLSPHPLPFPSPSPSSLRILRHSHPFSRSLSHTQHPALHPTHVHLQHSPVQGIAWYWNSRAHRKGVPPKPVGDDARAVEGATPAGWKVEKEDRRTKSWKDGLKWVREVRWLGVDGGDISWWVAAIFTLGSIFWCVNGIMAFCYFTNTSSTFVDTEAAFAFLGGTTFWVGAYLGWVESMNPADMSGTFGWTVDEKARQLLQPRKAHPHSSLGLRRRHFGSFASSSPPDSSSASPFRSSSASASAQPRKWRWLALPSLSPSRSSFSSSDPVSLHNLGYLANLVQFVGATLFQISVICGLPGVLPEAGFSGGTEQEGRSEGLWVGLYWAMQVAGAPCFVFSGLVFALEVQKRWYQPALGSIGWHIGIWNVIGGFGFFFSGLFGIWRQTSLADPEKYQYWGTAFSTFWGSWAFLIGSYLQLLETLNKWS
ncbi:hypothetical protein JCM10207_008618 [Rhodosporidiobolus poonsookiae]